MRIVPDPPFRRELVQILADRRELAEEIAVLVMHDANGLDVVAPLGPVWQPLPGRDKVRVYHIPNPSGAPGLFAMLALTEPGAHYAGSSVDASRLVGVAEGGLTMNDTPLTAGQAIWVPGGTRTRWSSPDGALCVVRYYPAGTPNPLFSTPETPHEP